MPNLTRMIDHDRLFKELLSTFFVEFLELFVPQVAHKINRDSVRFLTQEYFSDLTTGEKKIIDLLAEVQLEGQETGFLIHVENQASSIADFCRRIFFYFALLHKSYLKPIYPIVVFSFDEPYREEPHQYQIELEGLKVVEFNFLPIQLNRLNWRDYLNQQNPVAAALMSKMRIDAKDRSRVKVECLRMLATLKLDPARTQLISGFVDTYLRLNQPEERIFQMELSKLEEREQEDVMQIVTSWMEQGIERGIERGERSLILRQLNRRVGVLDSVTENQVVNLSLAQLDLLGEALLDFSGIADLQDWLQSIGQ
jgi:predicted transposase/invertase (TIGR01784 family)